MTLAAGMACCALTTSMAIEVNQNYDPLALGLLTLGLISCITAVVVYPSERAESFLQRHFTAILGVTVFISGCVMLFEFSNDRPIAIAVFLLLGLGVLQASKLGRTSVPLFLAGLIAFSAASAVTFLSPTRLKDPQTDVLVYQHEAAKALVHGRNPYEIRIPNMYNAPGAAVFHDPLRYGSGTPYYGPNIVDDQGWLKYGYAYPPLSLLMTLPSYLLAGDCRFAHLIAVGLSALMMALARPGRWAPLAGMLFLLTPQGIEIIDRSWTEPLLLCTFSLAMLCACRWPKAFPWALGLFCATKQYTILAVPAVWLLVRSPHPFRQFLDIWAKAALVVLAITVPFILWNPHEFFRAVVEFQVALPFRMDALSYLPVMFEWSGGRQAPIYTPFFAAVIPAAIALWRCPRTPAGFAAAVALTCMLFFAFGRAFGNYYYFVIGAACWCVAATEKPEAEFAAEAVPASAV